MSITGRMRNAYDASPVPVKRGAALVARLLPPGKLFGPAFGETWNALKDAEGWDQERLQQDQLERLRELLRLGRERVPYYRELFSEMDMHPEDINSVDEIAAIPLLTRAMVSELGEHLRPEGLSPAAYRHQTTGGTSGVPLGFDISHEASAREWAFMQWQWGRVGYRLGDRRAVLRGRAISGRKRGRLWEEDPLNNALYFSSFDLAEDLMPAMVEQMKGYGAAYLHAYPSSATILAEHLAKAGTSLPGLRALLLGSENMTPGQRTFIEEVFGARVYRWYGHSEKCILAGECEGENAYHPFTQYGVTEIVDSSGRPVLESDVPGTLVGTGFLNRAMLFIRYVTDDRAQWKDEPCACGRPGRRITDVVGRWDQEMLVGASGALISMTAINLHSDVYTRMRRFRFVQNEPGLVELLVVPVPGFSSEDERAILDELADKASGELVVRVKVVPELSLTASGKFTFVEQHLDLGQRPWAR